MCICIYIYLYIYISVYIYIYIYQYSVIFSQKSPMCIHTTDPIPVVYFMSSSGSCVDHSDSSRISVHAGISPLCFPFSPFFFLGGVLYAFERELSGSFRQQSNFCPHRHFFFSPPKTNNRYGPRHSHSDSCRISVNTDILSSPPPQNKHRYGPHYNDSDSSRISVHTDILSFPPPKITIDMVHITVILIAAWVIPTAVEFLFTQIFFLSPPKKQQ